MGKYEHSTKESVNDDDRIRLDEESQYNSRVNFIDTHGQ